MIRNQFLVLEVDDKLIGIDIEFVKGVALFENLSRVPGTKPFVAGLVNIRGNVYITIDIAKFLKTSQQFSNLVIINGGEGGDFAIIVSGIRSVEYLTLEENRQKFIIGEAKLADKDITVLEMKDIINELNEIHSTIIPKKKWFYFNDGRIAQDLEELILRIKVIDDETFKYHLIKGDFSKWIGNTLRMPELAEKVKKIDNKNDLISILKLQGQ